MKLAWGNKVSPEFKNKLLEICRNFRWTDNHASWLMSCIAFESGETFSPKILNQGGSGAVGLIQFMPKTAETLGVSSTILASMTPEQQLEYVRKYFAPYASKINTLEDMYMAILWPAAIGKPNDYPLFTDGTAAYRANSPLDKDTDGKVTKLEASSFVAQKYAKGLGYGYTSEEESIETNQETILSIVNEIDMLLSKLKENIT